MDDPILFVAVGGFDRSLVVAEALVYSISILPTGLIVAGAPDLSALLRATTGGYLIYLVMRLWRRIREQCLAASAPSAVQVHTTTLPNRKAIPFALQVLPFGSAHRWSCFLTILPLLAVISPVRIAAAVVLGGAARQRGRIALIPLPSAAIHGFLCLALFAMPFVR
ncbi:MAG TPA: hypothetical protein VHL31_01265 [Geminicoccus sp.]|uniref:hypothetical protein n=1 Tax=Geminicoccus sp. TaxID=2024832 RepID=UPI002E324CD0|nr:hypothetical protein [Geminicoccus sp.]HEX2524916.1 hypothetical protein [Geminicoccus sp.]